MIAFKYAIAFLLVAATCLAADAGTPKFTEADFIARDFKFANGQVLAELRIHYRTLGIIARDPNGRATNVVLIVHRTRGSGARLTEPPNRRLRFPTELS